MNNFKPDSTDKIYKEEFRVIPKVEWEFWKKFKKAEKIKVMEN